MEEEQRKRTSELPDESMVARQILKRWRTAFRSKDVAALISLYETDAYLEVSDLSIQAYGRTSVERALQVLVEGPDEVDIEWREPVWSNGIICSEYLLHGGILDGAGVAILGISGERVAFDKRFLMRSK
ncbi:MAG: hypothetical protein C4318_03195 [Acidimicrobiia bacterium]